MWKGTSALNVSSDDHKILMAWVRTSTTPQRVALRARICLFAADGTPTSQIVRDLGVIRDGVLLWCGRFEQGAPAALAKIASGRGRKPAISVEKINAVVNVTLHTTPPGATHWSLRTMAKAQAFSPNSVMRIWHAHGLQPHRVETFKLSNDPKFVDKLWAQLQSLSAVPRKAS